jgi:hypothetical protein
VAILAIPLAAAPDDQVLDQVRHDQADQDAQPQQLGGTVPVGADVVGAGRVQRGALIDDARHLRQQVQEHRSQENAGGEGDQQVLDALAAAQGEREGRAGQGQTDDERA